MKNFDPFSWAGDLYKGVLEKSAEFIDKVIINPILTGKKMDIYKEIKIKEIDNQYRIRQQELENIRAEAVMKYSHFGNLINFQHKEALEKLKSEIEMAKLNLEESRIKSEEKRYLSSQRREGQRDLWEAKNSGRRMELEASHRSDLLAAQREDRREDRRLAENHDVMVLKRDMAHIKERGMNVRSVAAMQGALPSFFPPGASSITAKHIKVKIYGAVEFEADDFNVQNWQYPSRSLPFQLQEPQSPEPKKVTVTFCFCVNRTEEEFGEENMQVVVSAGDSKELSNMGGPILTQGLSGSDIYCLSKEIKPGAAQIQYLQDGYGSPKISLSLRDDKADYLVFSYRHNHSDALRTVACDAYGEFGSPRKITLEQGSSVRPNPSFYSTRAIPATFKGFRLSYCPYDSAPTYIPERGMSVDELKKSGVRNAGLFASNNRGRQLEASFKSRSAAAMGRY